MQQSSALARILSFAFASIVGGCAVPHYDVPYTNLGRPTVTTIVERIQCEIRDLVRSDVADPSAPSSMYGPFLRSQDFDVLIAMSIDVNESGGLTPTMSYMNPLTSFTFSASGTLSESRDHTFTENLQFSARQIYLDWYSAELAAKAGIDPRSLGLSTHDCPPADTNLSGTLGISDFVAMAARSDGLNMQKTADSDGVFGGTIQFVVTKSVSAVGPTWALVHFNGPGGLGGLSQVNTDKITLAFARGPNLGKPLLLPTLAELKPGFRASAGRRATNVKAYMLLQQQLTSGINTQLTILQNTLRMRP
ncbi:hypothetical protein [Bradyrhizobium embrapense]|uniref:hypothetical protein n=1 Tax=Bradyrhizobium embrapense TaxID=630921 RepID=UPI00067E08F5|nr:hypothetical protein [Bradyrhizobium embrapense]